MKLFARVGLVAVLALGFTVFFCMPANYSWRQKLTLKVDTPTGVVSGAAVVQVWVSYYSDASANFGTEVTYDMEGDATLVEVLPRRYLFALPRDGENRFITAAQDRFKGLARGQSLRQISRQTEPVLVTGEQMPMLVTFDDINDPKSVRKVDPDDLDATFGCERETDATRFPWREAGQTYRQWARWEVMRSSREMAAERAGLSGAVGDAIEETYFIIDDRLYDAADEARVKQIRLLFTVEQQRQWNIARQALNQELQGTIPTPQTITAAVGGQCYRLGPVTLAITDEAVTQGEVESILVWLKSVWPNTLGGNRLSEINDQNRFSNSLSANSFSTEIKR
jgi:hypothetical protein